MKKFILLTIALTFIPLDHAFAELCSITSIVCNQLIAKEQSEISYADDPSRLFSHSSPSQIYTTPEVKPAVDRNFCMTNKSCSLSTSVLSSDYTEFLFSFSNMTKTSEIDFVANCSCLRKAFTSQYSPEELVREKQKIREDVNKKIKEAFGKKFVNDFSSNLEDLSFFLTKNRDMFKDPDKAKFSQCLDPDGFNAQIDFACKESGFSDPELIRQRKDFFINSVDHGNMPFEKRLMKMSEDIVSMEYPEAPGFPKGTVYSRFEYDSARMGLAHSDPKGKIIDEIVKKLILSKSFSADFNSALDRMAPALALESMLATKVDEPGELNSLGLSPEALAVVKDGANLRSHFQFLMNTHPGFMSLMEDDEVLRNLYGELKIDPSKSVLEHLESNPHVLEPVWGRKCAEMQDQFALAVCTPDDKLISLMNPDDFISLTKPEVDPYDTETGDIKDLLMCENFDKNGAKLTDLSRMNPNAPSHRSDYLERLTVPDVKQHKNMFSKSMLASMNKEFRDKMGVMAEKGIVISKSVSLPGILSVKVYAKAVSEDKAFSFGKQAMSKSEAKKFLKADKEYSDKLNETKLAKKEKIKEIESPKVAQNTNVANVQEPGKNQSAATNSARMITPQTDMPRQQLQRKLSETYKPSEISQALDKLSNENAVELNSLRAQNIDLLQKNFDLEKQRMESLQKKVDELQSKVDQAADPVSKPVTLNSKSFKESTVGTDEEDRRVVNTDKPIRPILAPIISGAATEDSSSVAPEAEPSNARSKPVVISNDLSAPSITVESADVQISAELRKFVESSDAETLSLEDIKKNGIKIMIDKKEVIVKYESLDQKTKDLLELKFAKKERDHQVSKLAVLRMLMNQRK